MIDGFTTSLHPQPQPQPKTMAIFCCGVKKRFALANFTVCLLPSSWPTFGANVMPFYVLINLCLYLQIYLLPGPWVIDSSHTQLEINEMCQKPPKTCKLSFRNETNANACVYCTWNGQKINAILWKCQGETEGENSPLKPINIYGLEWFRSHQNWFCSLSAFSESELLAHIVTSSAHNWLILADLPCCVLITLISRLDHKS